MHHDTEADPYEPAQLEAYHMFTGLPLVRSYSFIPFLCLNNSCILRKHLQLKQSQAFRCSCKQRPSVTYWFLKFFEGLYLSLLPSLDRDARSFPNWHSGSFYVARSPVCNLISLKSNETSCYQKTALHTWNTLILEALRPKTWDFCVSVC